MYWIDCFLGFLISTVAVMAELMLDEFVELNNGSAGISCSGSGKCWPFVNIVLIPLKFFAHE